VSTAPHLTLDALEQHPAGSVLPRATVGAPQGKRAAMLLGVAGVLRAGGAARLLGAVCAPQVASVRRGEDHVRSGLAIGQTTVDRIRHARIADAITAGDDDEVLTLACLTGGLDFVDHLLFGDHMLQALVMMGAFGDTLVFNLDSSPTSLFDLANRTHNMQGLAKPAGTINNDRNIHSSCAAMRHVGEFCDGEHSFRPGQGRPVAATTEVHGLEADFFCQTGAQRIVTQRGKDVGLGCQQVSECRHGAPFLAM
jgi:hypothetical protein